jgi:hypothetical protein
LGCGRIGETSRTCAPWCGVFVEDAPVLFDTDVLKGPCTAIVRYYRHIQEIEIKAFKP